MKNKSINIELFFTRFWKYKHTGVRDSCSLPVWEIVLARQLSYLWNGIDDTCRSGFQSVAFHSPSASESSETRQSTSLGPPPIPVLSTASVLLDRTSGDIHAP